MSKEEPFKPNIMLEDLVKTIVDQQKRLQLDRTREACKLLQAAIKLENFKLTQQKLQRGEDGF